MSLPLPKATPELGLYYHYKHDPDTSLNNYAYEVLGVGFHTEDNPQPGEAHFVIYRPLYDAAIYKISKQLNIPCFDTRPLEMWMENITKDSQIIPRFKKITDSRILKQLYKIREEMY